MAREAANKAARSLVPAPPTPGTTRGSDRIITYNIVAIGCTRPLHNENESTSDKTEASDIPAVETRGQTHREDCQAPKQKRRRLRGKQPEVKIDDGDNELDNKIMVSISSTEPGQVQHEKEKEKSKKMKTLSFSPTTPARRATSKQQQRHLIHRPRCARSSSFSRCL